MKGDQKATHLLGKHITEIDPRERRVLSQPPGDEIEEELPVLLCVLVASPLGYNLCWGAR